MAIYGRRTYQNVKDRIASLVRVNGYDIAAHKENGKIVITNTDESRNLSPYCTPREAYLWLDGYEEGKMPDRKKKPKDDEDRAPHAADALHDAMGI